MLEKTKLILKQSRVILRSVIADSQYSDCKLRNAVEQAVITYRSNQKRDVEGLLIGTRSLELADQIIRKRSITRDPIWKRSAVF
jgi:hypothetical protein